MKLSKKQKNNILVLLCSILVFGFLSNYDAIMIYIESLFNK